ncbi:MAG: hypothetical protein GXC78_16155, partial [Chitinophagaceae bacterium]|nr:hypothetical protein [Chitinophagaceae bacterium]
SVTKMPIRVRNDETSVATDDAGSNAAGFIKKYTSPNDFIQKLNVAGPKIGTNMVLKVMAGDKVNLFAKSWYKKNGVTPGTPNNPLTNILNVLEPAIGGITGTHGGAKLTELQTTSVLDNQVTSFLNSQSGYTTSKPKAFVNWVLFDACPASVSVAGSSLNT